MKQRVASLVAKQMSKRASGSKQRATTNDWEELEEWHGDVDVDEEIELETTTTTEPEDEDVFELENHNGNCSAAEPAEVIDIGDTRIALTSRLPCNDETGSKVWDSLSAVLDCTDEGKTTLNDSSRLPQLLQKLKEDGRYLSMAIVEGKRGKHQFGKQLAQCIDFVVQQLQRHEDKRVVIWASSGIFATPTADICYIHFHS